MCPRPGTRLNITATASLALPSAVCVAPRIQSQWSHRSASFGRRCPQYGHGILSPVLDSGGAAGASVYSTFIPTESPKLHRIRQANRIQTTRTTDDTDVTNSPWAFDYRPQSRNPWIAIRSPRFEELDC